MDCCLPHSKVIIHNYQKIILHTCNMSYYPSSPLPSLLSMCCVYYSPTIPSFTFFHSPSLATPKARGHFSFLYKVREGHLGCFSALQNLCWKMTLTYFISQLEIIFNHVCFLFTGVSALDKDPPFSDSLTAYPQPSFLLLLVLMTSIPGQSFTSYKPMSHSLTHSLIPFSLRWIEDLVQKQ